MPLPRATTCITRLVRPLCLRIDRAAFGSRRVSLPASICWRARLSGMPGLRPFSRATPLIPSTAALGKIGTTDRPTYPETRCDQTPPRWYRKSRKPHWRSFSIAHPQISVAAFVSSLGPALQMRLSWGPNWFAIALGLGQSWPSDASEVFGEGVARPAVGAAGRGASWEASGRWGIVGGFGPVGPRT